MYYEDERKIFSEVLLEFLQGCYRSLFDSS
jgi:hypothetical protein